jgi:hypothetical protein
MTDSPTRSANTGEAESGEVAIREQGGVTAVETDSFDGEVSIDFDHDPPLVGVPEEVAVVYEDGNTTVSDEQVAADGGFVRENVRVRQYGLGLDREQRNIVVTAMAGAFAVAGYLWGTASEVAAMVSFTAAGVLAYVLYYWQDYHGGDA